MRILIINVVCGIRSTGRICTDLATRLEQEGHEVRIAYGRGKVPTEYQRYAVKIGNILDQGMHVLRTRLLDQHGFGSRKATRKFLDWAGQYKPDMLWLHNIHGYYINVELLFDWIKRYPEMQVKWTLHDCWAFTGHCAYFTMAGCGKWRDGCMACIQRGRYPASIWRDNSKEDYERKKAAFTGVNNMTIITPSRWLAELVSQSYLQEYPIAVRYNTVDTRIFKSTPGGFREQHHLEDKKIILGVASAWDERKGLQDFFRLARMLDDSYVIVLVGLDKKQRKKAAGMVERARIPAQETGRNFKEKCVHTDYGEAVHADVWELYAAITGREYGKEKRGGHATLLCLPVTNSANELAEIYTAADLFVNPTYEDNFPTVNLEAIACGTYVITYLTGGSPETISYAVHEK